VAIARNIWLNELNKKQRSGQRDKVFEIGRGQLEPDITRYIDDREKKARFRQLLNTLGEPCKKILTMFYYDNMSMKEMVEHLNFENEQVVRNKKYKCLQQLTKLVSEQPEISRQIKQPD
jgi:RNA polymerase sigma factor (sigma-70 family)